MLYVVSILKVVHMLDVAFKSCTGVRFYIDSDGFTYVRYCIDFVNVYTC